MAKITLAITTIFGFTSQKKTEKKNQEYGYYKHTLPYYITLAVTFILVGVLLISIPLN